jgi:phosphomannomutase
LDELERLRERFGRYVNRQTSFTLTGAEGAVKIREAIERLHANERTSLASLRFERHVRDGVLIYDLEDGGRVAVRPSGTEPKLKFYLEAVGSDATARLDAVEADILRAAGLEQA